MVASIQEHSFRMKFLARASICGLMVRLMQANGTRTKCTAMEFSNGPTANSMKGTSSMISAKAQESSNGRMDVCMTVNGLMASNMEEELSSK